MSRERAPKAPSPAPERPPAQGSEATWEAEANRYALGFLAREGGFTNLPVPGGEEPRGVHSLPGSVRYSAESLLGRDFSGVRLRTGARDLGSAHAETSGSEIRLAPGRFRPEHPLGRALLVHELTHVAQQGAAPARTTRPPGGFGAALELRRSTAGSAALEAQRATVTEPLTPGITPAPAGTRQRCSGESTTSAPAPTSTPATPPPGPTPGEVARTRSEALVQQDDTTRDARGRLEGALREIRRGAALEFHRTQTPDLIRQGGTALGWPAATVTARLADWTWFLDHGPPGANRASDADFSRRRDAFLATLRSELQNLNTRHPRSQAANWIKNTPASVFQLCIEVATPAIPAAFLYVSSAREGLIDQYIRAQVPGAASDRLSNAEMATVRTDRPVSGFNMLGLDDFFTDLAATRQPLAGFLPTGFDPTRLTETPHVNEQGRTVRSADAPDLRTALQAKMANMARRRAIFEEDRVALGYPAPTGDETVYFVYVYYNSGTNEGRRTLNAHRPAHPTASERRTFQNWITRGDYPNAQVVLRSYQMITEAGILRGY
ncbi:MAG: DUF4157 domain-containing protein [Thermoanaerobaculia bacterium]|nr:DUF4157 domain-containing protein [Thermoanaerobaculia bacterium]